MGLGITDAQNKKKSTPIVPDHSWRLFCLAMSAAPLPLSAKTDLILIGNDIGRVNQMPRERGDGDALLHRHFPEHVKGLVLVDPVQ